MKMRNKNNSSNYAFNNMNSAVKEKKLKTKASSAQLFIVYIWNFILRPTISSNFLFILVQQIPVDSYLLPSFMTIGIFLNESLTI